MTQHFIFGNNLEAKKHLISKDVDFTLAKKFDSQKHFGKAYGGQTSTAAQGGEGIPLPLADRFIKLVENQVFARQLFKTIPMSAATLEIPVQTGMHSAYLLGEGVEWLTEGGAAGASTTQSRSTWSSITLTAKKFGALGGYTTELAEDAILNFGDIVMNDMAKKMAYSEEKAFIQGELSGTTTGFGSGDVRYAFDGLIWHVYGDNASTGANWTPDNASPVMSQDGGSDILTADELNVMIAKIEEQGFNCDTIMMRPTVRARMRDATEFEMLQSMKDIGQQAALLKGHVGNYYTAKLLVSQFMPLGTSSGIDGTGLEFVTEATDTLILGFDSREPVIGDKRRVEVRKRHRFYQDIEEVRFTERLAFDVERPLALSMIADVKNAVA